MGPRSSHSVVLISTRMAIAHCTGVWLQIAHDHIRRVMLFPVTPTMKATTSCYYYIFQSFFRKKKTLVKNRSKILTTNCYFDFVNWILLPYKTRLLRFASARRHRGLQNHRVQRVYSGPQGLAFCSGNFDRDPSGIKVWEIISQNQPNAATKCGDQIQDPKSASQRARPTKCKIQS